MDEQGNTLQDNEQLPQSEASFNEQGIGECEKPENRDDGVGDRDEAINREGNEEMTENRDESVGERGETEIRDEDVGEREETTVLNSSLILNIIPNSNCGSKMREGLNTWKVTLFASSASDPLFEFNSSSLQTKFASQVQSSPSVSDTLAPSLSVSSTLPPSSFLFHNIFN
ncbi:hypothetical protein Salat_0657100 [Sesamum alatum]|uniref:Uncharacterized protein n=1 Tax=Sesamum alatum TaxID=300844 RepID=A0AAE1YS16_9LAMI|nr:hypothetical protein Salat_0657100 [Sesamum alatum]